jgi:hypothetical protein
MVEKDPEDYEIKKQVPSIVPILSQLQYVTAPFTPSPSLS